MAAEYALDGFELNAVDFLHKPFSYGRFERTVNKIRELKNLKSLVSKPIFTDETINIKVEYRNITLPVGRAYVNEFYERMPK